MDAKEFNKLASQLMKQELGPLGFKKSRIHFAVYDPPKIMTVYKKTFRGSFEGYYIAVTYDFMSNTKMEKGVATPPPYLEDYPTSISIPRLLRQYEAHDSIPDFECGLHLHSYDKGLSQNAAIAGMIAEQSVSSAVTNLPEAAEQYIRETIEHVKTNGIRFLHEITPAISLEFLDRHLKEPWCGVDSLKEDLRKHLSS